MPNLVLPVKEVKNEAPQTDIIDGNPLGSNVYFLNAVNTSRSQTIVAVDGGALDYSNMAEVIRGIRELYDKAGDRYIIVVRAPKNLIDRLRGEDDDTPYNVLQRDFDYELSKQMGGFVFEIELAIGRAKQRKPNSGEKLEQMAA